QYQHLFLSIIILQGADILGVMLLFCLHFLLAFIKTFHTACRPHVRPHVRPMSGGYRNRNRLAAAFTAAGQPCYQGQQQGD
ncbi:MAG: hypothetical protein ACOX6L_03025, partial [Syntrophomonadaceae bacterium]